MRLFWSSLVVAAFSWNLSGCGSTDDPGVGAPPPESPPNNDLAFKTGDFEVPAGDSFECFYTDVTTDKELSVTSATGQQGPGGHHVVVYYTDAPRDPTHHPCDDSEMVSWHQIAGSGGDDTSGAEGLIGLPDGLAIRVPAGKQLVLQAHYINTTGATQTVSDSVTLHTVEPKDVKAYANYFVMVDAGFEVPPLGTLTSTSTCTLQRDLDTVVMLGHMHEHGKHYKLEQLNGDVAETLYEKDWQPSYASHPPTEYHSMAAPLTLKQGTRLRQTCEWNNTTADPLLFPREMCVAFFYYFPDVGQIECELDTP
jgi:hypothetical protein